jgi:hypothetical protein
VFAQAAELRSLGLGVPAVTEVVGGLAAAGLLPPETPTVTTVEEAVAVLIPALG